MRKDQYIIKNATDEQIIKMVSVYNNNQEYEQSLSILSYCIYECGRNSDTLIKEYLFTIYSFRKYENHNQTRYEYFIEEYDNLIKIIKQKDIALVYLRLIRDKAIKKSYSKIKKKLIKVIENYAKSK